MESNGICKLRGRVNFLGSELGELLILTRLDWTDGYDMTWLDGIGIVISLFELN